MIFDDPEEDESEAEQIYGSIQKVIDEGGQEVYAGLSLPVRVVVITHRNAVLPRWKHLWHWTQQYPRREAQQHCLCSDGLAPLTIQLAELHDTEVNYVKVLHSVADGFMSSLSAHPKIISKVVLCSLSLYSDIQSDLRVIFSNVGELLKAHTDFLRELEYQMKSQTGRIVSEPFYRAVCLVCIRTLSDGCR